MLLAKDYLDCTSELGFLGCSVRGQELGLILMDPFKLSVFCDKLISGGSLLTQPFL